MYSSRGARSRKGTKVPSFPSRFSIVLLLLCLASIPRNSSAQRAIASLGAKLKKLGRSESKSTDVKYIIEGERPNKHHFLQYTEVLKATTMDWKSIALLASCVVLATRYIGAPKVTAQDEEGESIWTFPGQLF